MAGTGGAGGTAGAGSTCDGADEFIYAAENRCYRFVDDPLLDWPSALSDCESWGGTLAALTTSEENLFVSAYVIDHTWIGGSDAATPNVWEWTSGEPWV